jgi:hypothetical protein
MLRTWVLRPILWFAAASIATTILHELAHACVAFVLGVRSTLFSYWANLDLTPAQAASALPLLISIAGPLFSLGSGIVCWLAYRRSRGASLALPLLYLSVFGLGTFFGNLLSTPFAGDFSQAATALRLPIPVRYAIAAAGAICVAALHWWAGRELARAVPPRVDRVMGMLGIVTLPVVLGTAAMILVNQPMPRTWVNVRIAEAGFWLFAAVGALMIRESQRRAASLHLHWADVAVALVGTLAVRLMVRGIPFTP